MSSRLGPMALGVKDDAFSPEEHGSDRESGGQDATGEPIDHWFLAVWGAKEAGGQVHLAVVFSRDRDRSRFWRSIRRWAGWRWHCEGRWPMPSPILPPHPGTDRGSIRIGGCRIRMSSHYASFPGKPDLEG